MTVDVTEVEGDGGTSRRKVLKRAAAAGAAAWTVPMVLGTSDASATGGISGGKKCIANGAAADPPRAYGCVTCPSCDNQCGNSPHGQCCCFVNRDGCCFCGVSSFCTDVACTSSAQCPPGFLCAYTCCSTQIQCIETCVHANTGGPAPARARSGQMSGTRN